MRNPIKPRKERTPRAMKHRQKLTDAQWAEYRIAVAGKEGKEKKRAQAIFFSGLFTVIPRPKPVVFVPPTEAEMSAAKDAAARAKRSEERLRISQSRVVYKPEFAIW